MSTLTAPAGPAATAPAPEHPTPAPRRAFDLRQLREALPGAFRKLDPRLMWHNPVMFVVEVGAVLTTGTGGRRAVRRPPRALGRDRDPGHVHGGHRRLALAHRAVR
jgi:K+-transporting ATPase ATPase B chain